MLHDAECCVCYEFTTDTLECRHALCHVCYDKWYVAKGTCPVCRDSTHEPCPDPPEDTEVRILRPPFDEWLASAVPDEVITRRWLQEIRTPHTRNVVFSQLVEAVQVVNPGSVRLSWLPWRMETLQTGDIVTHMDRTRIRTVEQVARGDEDAPRTFHIIARRLRF